MKNGKTEEDLDVISTSSKTIKLRAPQGSHYLKATKIAGQDISLLGFYLPLLCVAEIDGEPQPLPISGTMMEKLSDRLGVEALNEVVVWYNMKQNPDLAATLKENPDLSIEEANLIAEGKKRERLKNSSEIQ